MSGSLIGGIVGGAIGFILGGPTGAFYGFSLGSAAGAMLFPEHQDGPRLTDLKPQSSEYGRPIPIVYGTVAIGGNVIWASDYIEEDGAEGGKGSGGGVTTHTYYGNFAIAFAEGPRSIGRMWAGPEKRLIYDGAVLEGGGSVRIYTGSEDQLPDPLIESYLGVGDVPAYRGTCYVVFERFPLVKDGNTLPFITAEVGAQASDNAPPPTYLGTASTVPANTPAMATMDSGTGWVWTVAPMTNGSTLSVSAVSDATKEDIATVTEPAGVFTPVGVCAVPTTGEVWVIGQKFADNQCYAYIFDAGSINPDGTVLAAPSFKTALVIQGITYPAAVAFDADTGDVMIAGGFSTTTTMALYRVNAAGRAVIQSGAGQIGFPTYIVPGGAYVGVSLESSSAGIEIFDANTTASVRSVSLTTMYPGQSFTFDSKRNVFVMISGPGKYDVIDPATGVPTTHTLTIPSNAQSSPAPNTNVRTVVYAPQTDSYYFGADGGNAGAATTLLVVPGGSNTVSNAFTYETGQGKLLSPLLAPAAVSMTTSSQPYLLSFDQGNVKRLYPGGLPTATPVGLGIIIADLSARAGLAPEQIDVSALTDEVPGYAISRQTTVRNAIDALRPAFYFDAVESGGVVKYVKRGGVPVASIPLDDLDARNGSDSPGDPLLTTRQMEVELPRVVNVNYLLAATDYSPATKLAKRLVGASGNETTLDLPLVLSDTKAQEVADVNLQVAWAQRLTYQFNLPRTYSYLEPTDHIVINGNGMRLTKITYTPQGVLKCEAVADGSAYYTSSSTTIETPASPQTVYTPGTTSLELM